MAETPQIAIAAPDADAAAQLLAVVPKDSDPHIVMFGSSAAPHLKVSRITLLPRIDFRYSPDVLGPALWPVVEEADVLVLDSTQYSRDLAGWAVGRLGVSLVWAADSIRTTGEGVVEVDRITLGGSHRLVHELVRTPAVVLARAGRSVVSTSGSPEVVVNEMEPGPSSVRVTAGDTIADGLAPLSGSRIVVSIGRGIGGPENVSLFVELAKRLGAALGGSRVVVDAGWLPFSQQVGQTGTAVAPDLYLAFGISGAIQHLAGMRSSSRIVAINTDPEAPLCSIADVHINSDACDFAESLLSRIMARSNE